MPIFPLLERELLGESWCQTGFTDFDFFISDVIGKKDCAMNSVSVLFGPTTVKTTDKTMSPHEDSQPIRELKWLAQFFDSHGHEQGVREIAREIKRVRRMAQSTLGEKDASNVIEFASPEKETKPIAELRWLAQFFSARGHHESAREINEQLNRLGCSNNQDLLLDRPMRNPTYENAQVLKELQWLAKYFKEHGADQTASKIYSMIKQARKKAQSTLSGEDASDVQYFGTDQEAQENDVG